MARIDHARTNARDLMRQRGVDSIADFGLPGGLNPPKRRPSKAELRAEAEAALAKASRIVRCAGCGHSAAVAIPAAKLGRRLRCSRCGMVANETPAAVRAAGARTAASRMPER